MDRYRKLPVVIEAVQWDGTPQGATPIIDWILQGDGTASWHEETPELRARNGELVRCFEMTHIAVDTMEGRMQCQPGDWIIRGVAGEHYPCKPDIFARTYEPLGDL